MERQRGAILLALLLAVAILAFFAQIMLHQLAHQVKLHANSNARIAEQQIVNKLEGTIREALRGQSLLPAVGRLRTLHSLPRGALPGIRDTRFLPSRRGSLIITLQLLDRRQIYSRNLDSVADQAAAYCSEPLQNGTVDRPAGQGSGSTIANWIGLGIDGAYCIRARWRLSQSRWCKNKTLELKGLQFCTSPTGAVIVTYPHRDLTKSTNLVAEAITRSVVVAKLRDDVAIFLDRTGCLRRYSFATHTHQPLGCKNKTTELEALRSFPQTQLTDWIALEFQRRQQHQKYQYPIYFPRSRLAERTYAEILEAFF